jgi:superfamily II DNA helicase RecQ
VSHAVDESLLVQQPWESDDGRRRGTVLALGERGAELLHDEAVLEGAPVPDPWTEPARGKRRRGTRAELAPALPDGVDAALREELRQWRLRRARDAKRPPYAVFPDRVLDQLAAHPPSNRAEFLAIQGLGEGRWDDFGEELLARVAAWREGRGGGAVELES